MADPVLLFGIGATKAGTSWLHRYLAGHPDCALRSIKELHFFDTAEDTESHAWYMRDFERKGEALARRIAEAPETPDDDRVFRLAELPAERLARMARLRQDVRLVYLMRDPVDRLWSHVRMIAKRRGAERGLAAEAAALLDRVLAGQEDHIALRGDYRSVLEKPAVAVDPGRAFVCTCEDLFEGDALARLCGFLGIEFIPADPATRVHAGEPAALRPDQRARATEYLRSQYDYVADRIGRLPPLWEANRAGV